MSKSSYPLKLPHSIKDAAARLAKQDGVSLNHWISVAVAEKIGAVQTAEEFFAARREGRTIDDMRAILERVPDVPPMPGDEIE